MTERTNLTEVEVNVIVMKSVRETLTALGIDVSDTKSLLSVQADFAHLRNMRKTRERMAEYIAKTLVGAIAVAALALLWQGFQFVLNRGPQ